MRRCVRIFVVGLASVCAAGCAQPVDADADGFLKEADCNDDDASVGGERTWYTDADADGFGGAEVAACTPPDGAASRSGDCDDEDPAVRPGSVEVCDGVDNDCDGVADDEAVDRVTVYVDADGDGFGNDSATVSVCEVGAGQATAGGDCDDARAEVNPGEAERCDALDNDCDGTVDGTESTDAPTWYPDADTDGEGALSYAVTACEAPDGWVDNGDDCDDQDASSFHGGVEVCDGADNDCDGTVDDGAADATAWYADADGDGFGDEGAPESACAAPDGYVAVALDCDDTAASVYPGAREVCDGVDNDCDSSVDDNAADAPTWHLDHDGDGYGDPTYTSASCSAAAGWVAGDDDCDDLTAAAHPGATERCDGLDNDCDGEVDPDCTDTGDTGGSVDTGDSGDTGGDTGGDDTLDWETPLSLDHQVTDAEYDHVNDLIVTVSADDRALYVLDPRAGTVEAVALPVDPISVSVDPAGGVAVVGHDAWVSEVDLLSLTVLVTWPVSTEAFDVVAGGNGWAYVFPEEDQWEDIRCVDLSDGSESLHSGSSIYENTVARLHPDGDRMYGANNGLSPSDFERYDISGGAAVYDYDSPYHGTYSFSGDIWISDDGERLFARARTVFRASNDSTTDMLYAGAFSSISGNLDWVDTCSADDRVYVVREADVSDVYVFTNTYLTDVGTVPLPELEAGGRSYALYPRQVFAETAGGVIHVLAEVPASSGLLDSWAVLSFDATSLP